LREVIQAYQHACVEVITRFEGHVAKYLGDGLLVYFGYPTAHEDDAARAVRAGLGIIEAIQALPGQHPRVVQPLQARIGIHTGLVVAGEMGSGEYREQLAIVGETPNIAARLQEQAAPNSVVISPTTYRLVTGLFECQDLGPQTLKGISTPLPMYRVLREGEAQSRFEVAVSTGLTPLVGREHEIELLQEQWKRAKQGDGQVVLLNGEAGIGKSRLIQAFKEQVLAEGAIRIEFRCSAYHQNSALYPIIEHLQRLLRFQREESPYTKLAKLRQALAQYRFPQADTLPLLASLLSLPHPEGTPLITLSPQKQKQKTQEALVAWIVEEAEKVAVYCVWEDLHWADPSTLEMLTLFFDQVPTTRLLAVLTFRPNFTPPWQPRPHITPLTLTHLGRHSVEAMMEKITDGKPFPREVLQQVVAKTDGVPLFVEELTKMVLESGLLTAVDDHYELTGLLPPLAIPSTLQDSLMARLDRLAPVREIAQLGATLGREFSYELLHAVSSLDEGTLQQGLRQLVEAELIYQRGLPPQATYFFKHALIQDAAYQSLLKSTRRQYHQQIAQVLEEKFSEAKETQPELLAHHYTEAGLIAQATVYWQRAGQRAIERSANLEAINHLTKGLEIVKTLPDSPERARQELMLQITLGTPLTATKGFRAPEVGRVYARAQELYRQVEKTSELLPVLSGLLRFHLMRAELQMAHELAEQLLRLAQSAQDSSLLLEAHRGLGVTLFYRGELAPALAHLEQGIACYDLHQHRSHAFSYVIDPGVFCLTYAALTLWLLGYPDQALERSHQALTLAQELSHPYSLAFTLSYGATLHQLRRERQAVQEQAGASITLSTEHGFPFYSVYGTILRGWALAEQGQGEEGIALMCKGLHSYEATGAALKPYFLILLAQTYEQVGKAEEGLTVLAEALKAMDKTGERWWEAELYRLKGELTLQSKVPDPKSKVGEIEEYFHKAIDIARRQSAKLLELRAVMSLSRLWQQQGKQAEARQLLAAIYGWFTEGFDTKDMQEAKILLEELT
ncbi:MAG TPA: AAA family ATPase, partial [Candidatus Binatia bacterium]|nr:AAA family ATPase [Candidatus Binatia bacterium]